MIKDIVKRMLAPLFYRLHNRKIGQKMEIKFWRRWINSDGWLYKDDFKSRINPLKEITQPHSSIINALYSCDPVSVLDVGSGPITGMGYIHPTVTVEIKACDPNADFYNQMLEKRGIVPPVKTEKIEGERLLDRFKQPFDYITCTNAMDHMESPDQCIHQMLKLIKPNGVIYLQHEINEGLKEGYRGYHKWNICKISCERFKIWNPERSFEYDSRVLGLGVAVNEVNGNVQIFITDNKSVLNFATQA